MRIFQAIAHYPPKIGGAQQRVKDLSERLAKKGHQVEVFTSDIGCPKDKQIKSIKNIKIHYLPAKEIAHTPIIHSLYKELMKIPQDSIVHVHIAQAYVPEVVYRVCKKKNIPYIAHIRGNPEPSSFIGKLILNPYKKIFLSKVLRNAYKIIALNEDYRNLFSKLYKIDKSKFVVIPNATDFRIIKNKNLHFNSKLKNILFVGRLTDEKNVESIIQALSLLKDKFIKFKIAGSGEYKQKLINLVKELKLNKRVIFLGELNRNDLYNEYLRSDLVLLPSKYECFSSVLLEAMATGTPIIASDIPGTRNVIKNGYNGLLVKHTPEKIAEAIEKLIKNPKLREKLARNGLKEVKKYSWDKIVEQTEKVYEEVLREHNKKLKQRKK